MFKRKKKQINPGKVITPVGHPNPPTQNEQGIATLLALHYRTDVEFVVPVDDFKRSSPDIIMNGVTWEIKAPIGNSKSTIYKQFRRASKQAKNIVIDTCQTKLEYERIVTSVKLEMSKRHAIRKVILIDKSKKIVEFFK